MLLCELLWSSNHHRQSWHLRPQSHTGSWVTDRATHFLFVLSQHYSDMITGEGQKSLSTNNLLQIISPPECFHSHFIPSSFLLWTVNDVLSLITQHAKSFSFCRLQTLRVFPAFMKPIWEMKSCTRLHRHKRDRQQILQVLIFVAMKTPSRVAKHTTWTETCETTELVVEVCCIQARMEQFLWRSGLQPLQPLMRSH